MGKSQTLNIKITFVLIIVVFLDKISLKNVTSTLTSVNHYPKNWFAYVRTLLFTGIEKYFNQFVRSKDWSKNSFILKRSKYLILEMYRANFLKTRKRKKIPFINVKRWTSEIKWPLSFVAVAGRGTKLTRHRCGSRPLHNLKVQGHSHFFTLNFFLDRRLRLKIEINYMYFVLKNIYSCYSGNVSVQSFTLRDTSPAITYCGIRNYMVVFPHYHNVSILLSLRHYVQFLVLALYTATDVNQSINCNVSNINRDRSITLDFVTYTIPLKIYNKKFHLQVEKWQIMNIIVHLLYVHSIWTVDGPSTTSYDFREISQNSSRYQFVTSSHHYLIYIEIMLKHKLQKIIKYKCHERKPDKTFSLSETTKQLQFLYPKGIFSKNTEVYVLKICASKWVKLNITINYLRINWLTFNENCFFHGLSIYNILNTIKEEISTTCWESFGTYRHRNIYTESNVIFLVLYSYKKQGSMNASIFISTTTCNAIEINICSISNRSKVYLSAANSICSVFQITHDLSISSFENLISRGCKMCELKNLQHSEKGITSGEILEIRTSGFMRGKLYVPLNNIF